MQSEQPNFHLDGTRSWGLHDNALAFLQRFVVPGSTTLETGAGKSTVFFAKLGCQHTAITPDSGEIARIKDHCTKNGIDLSKVTFLNGPSQDVLPNLEGSFDFFLVDGGHGFPLPQIDWFYGARLLKVGGVVAIDDVHAWTGAIMRDFLKRDPAWSYLGTEDYKTSCFRIVQPFKVEEFNEQPYVRAISKRLFLKRKLQRIPGRIARGEWAQMYRSFIRSIS